MSFLMVREAGLELSHVGIPLYYLMPESIAINGLAALSGVRQCQRKLFNFIPVRLKIRLNFMAARNVPTLLWHWIL